MFNHVGYYIINGDAYVNTNTELKHRTANSLRPTQKIGAFPGFHIIGFFIMLSIHAEFHFIFQVSNLIY